MVKQLRKIASLGLRTTAVLLATVSWAAADPLYTITDFGPASVTAISGGSATPGDIRTGNRVSIDDAGQVTVAPWGQPGSAYTGPLPPEMETNTAAGGFPRSAVVYAEAGGNVAGWGFQTNTGQLWRGFAVINGVPYGIGDPNGSGQAFGVNNSGQVVGWAAQTGAYLFTPATGIQKFDTPLQIAHPFSFYAYAINDSGSFVGQASPNFGSSITHAFLGTSASSAVDLNTLIPSTSGWTLISAMGINDSGQIAVFGVNAQGQVHALRLDPVSVPEPTVLAGFALVGAGLAARRGWPRRPRRFVLSRRSPASSRAIS